jgi:acetyltransferase
MSVWISDLRDFLDSGGRIPADLSPMAHYLGAIVAETTSRDPDQVHELGIRCRRRPRHRSCPGNILSTVDSPTGQICWECPICSDRGFISDWQGSPWDRRSAAAPPGGFTASAPTIERLTLPADDADIHGLAELLVDTVESGSAVSFLSPLTVETAEAWWRRTIAASDARAIFLVARDDVGIVGTVQLHPAWAPNQPHRAEIVKLIAHRRARGAGLGSELMRRIEDEARRAGFRLLTLDTKRGAAAEHLYRRLGWTAAGTIPRYAYDPDGHTPHDAVIFYKDLWRPDATGRR